MRGLSTNELMRVSGASTEAAVAIGTIIGGALGRASKVPGLNL